MHSAFLFHFLSYSYNDVPQEARNVCTTTTQRLGPLWVVDVPMSRVHWAVRVLSSQNRKGDFL